MTQQPNEYQFELAIDVRDYEVDSQGIVNNAIYLHYMEHTRHEFCRAAGTSFRDMQADGLDPVLRKAEVEYLTPLRLGDRMISKMNLVREGARFIFVQDIFLEDGTPVARGLITCVCLDHGRLSRGDRMAAYFKKFI